jgi:hypothetical protein
LYDFRSIPRHLSPLKRLALGFRIVAMADLRQCGKTMLARASSQLPQSRR